MHDNQLFKSSVDSVRVNLTQHSSELLKDRDNVSENIIKKVFIEVKDEIF